MKLLITPVPVFSPAIKTRFSSPGDCIFIPLTGNYASNQREVVAVTATHSADITGEAVGVNQKPPQVNYSSDEM